MTETEFKKIMEIEEAIINSLHKCESIPDIGTLSKALKDVTTVKMMNLQMYADGVEDDDDDPGIVTAHGMLGPGHPDFIG